MMGLIWLASYPKSGNTWLRFMLSAYIFGPPEASIAVAQQIPDIHRSVPGELPPGDPEIIKTHFMLTDEHPRLGETTGAIHIMRNPRDVALSALNYRKLAGESDRAFTEADYLESFINAGGDLDWLRIGFGTWAQHARSWTKTQKFPVLSLRYEQLKADPDSGLRSMIEFLNIDLDKERLKHAIKASSFDEMRALEIREKKIQKPEKNPLEKRLFIGTSRATRKGVFFVNKGASGQSLSGISPKLEDAFVEAFADDMREFGYEP